MEKVRTKLIQKIPSLLLNDFEYRSMHILIIAKQVFPRPARTYARKTIPDGAAVNAMILKHVIQKLNIQMNAHSANPKVRNSSGTQVVSVLGRIQRKGSKVCDDAHRWGIPSSGRFKENQMIARATAKGGPRQITAWGRRSPTVNMFSTHIMR